MDDKRFIHAKTDPKFRRIPKGTKKVKIDKRFQSMFNEDKFKVKYTIDKRGRPINKTSTEDLRRYYDLDSNSDQESETTKIDHNEQSNDDGDNDLKKTIKSDKKITEEERKKLKDLTIDYARGEANLYNESSTDDDDDEIDEDTDDVENEIEHKWGELDNDAEKTEEATYRLAACNMDWDRIRSIDLMVLFNSFLPAGGVVKSVEIFPSEFGKERMKNEEISGPTELVESKNNNDDDDENEEGSSYHMEKLRQYQLNRLKYYYAIITFDNVNSANKIYTECDGMEYESSATKLDLRFVPDDMKFDDEPKEICDKLPEVNKYQPRFFTTTALQQAKVNLTWDETDPSRIEIAQKLNSGKIDDISEADLQNYLASSDEESDENDENLDNNEDNNSDNNDNESITTINKYKALLQDIEEKENKKKNKDVEMEISWGINLKEKTDELIKKKLEENEDKTPFEKYLDKKKEKRKQKRLQKIKNNQSDDDNSDDIPSDIDLNDPYFAEEFNNDEFKRKKSKTKKNEINEENEEINNEKKAELELLLMNEDDDDNNKRHFSLKKIQQQQETKKKKKRKTKDDDDDDDDSKGQIEDDFQINLNDSRFSALYNSHLYNIDPSDSHYKKTKGMEAIINEKIKRRQNENQEEKLNTINNDRQKDPELSVLIKSVKRKTKALTNNNNSSNNKKIKKN